MAKRVHVVAAVIENPNEEVLIAKRPDHVHQGGLWEFPGGKIESDENVTTALVRELEEEVGITPTAFHPLIQIQHDYPDKSVLLDVWRVTRIHGEPHGREGQPVRWVEKASLIEFEFPAANKPIITAARLPDHYVITPEPESDPEYFDQLKLACQRFPRAIFQFRAKLASRSDFMYYAHHTIRICREHGVRILVNSEPAFAVHLGADGVHLTSARLLELEGRPLGRDKWVAASCHSEAEIRHAEMIGVDFIVLAPVLPTSSHPEATPLGWERFAELARHCTVPVYALGGMQTAMLDEAQRHGAQGIAGISLFSSKAS